MLGIEERNRIMQMTLYDKFMTRACKNYGKRFDTTALDRRFICYYNTQQRIKVDCGGGQIETGTVGMTTGWKPVFLLIHRSNDNGSGSTLTGNTKIIAVRVKGKYVPI